MALVHFINQVISALNNGNIAIGVFIDLKKAFDTVNHDIMLKKLYKYGIRGVAHKWFKSYLAHRMQYVSFKNSVSTDLVVNCGVPQGSILRPLLFLLYINDINAVSSVVTPFLFADDTSLLLQGKNSNTVVESINNELKFYVD